MNEGIAKINATLDRIVRAAPRLKRDQVRTLTARIRAINEDIERRQSEHQVSARHLNTNGRGNADPHEHTIKQPGRAVRLDGDGGGYHPDVDGWARNAR